MKKTILIAISTLMMTSCMQAQKQLSLSEVLQTLSDMQVFVENRKLKEDIVKQVKATGQKPGLTIVQYEQLKREYNLLRYTYNDVYLATIKKDISSIKEVKKMLKDPFRYSDKYADQYRIVVNQYNDEFLSTITMINGVVSNGDLPIIISIAKNLFEKIVAVIGKRKEDREERLQLVLSTMNNLLFKKLELPVWYDLNIDKPVLGNSVNPGKPSLGKNGGTTIQQIPVTSQVPLTLEPLEGSIKFQYWANGELAPMAYQRDESNLVEVVNTKMMGDQIVGKPTPVSKPVSVYVKTIGFRTKNAYPAGTYYKLAVEGNGLLYVFAVNSGNKMYGFYPGVGTTDELEGARNFRLPLNADQVIGKPTAGGIGTVVNIPDKDNFITISDKPGAAVPESETLIVLISRVEVDIQTLMEKMESMGSKFSPQERLTKILGTQAAGDEDIISAVKNGTISYMLNMSEQDVIPLTFSVLRK